MPGELNAPGHIGPDSSPRRSSPLPQGLPLRSVSRGHTNQEQFLWFPLPDLPSSLGHFCGGREGKTLWVKSRSRPRDNS